MSGCRIGRVKFKSGGEVRLLPISAGKFRRVRLGEWGEVTFRMFDGTDIENQTMNYMLDMAKHEIMYGEDEE